MQTEERVQPEYQRRRGAGGAPSVSHVTHARHQESCLHTTRTSFSLPIPLSSTPGFCTAIGETLAVVGVGQVRGQNKHLYFSTMTDPASSHFQTYPTLTPHVSHRLDALTPQSIPALWVSSPTPWSPGPYGTPASLGLHLARPSHDQVMTFPHLDTVDIFQATLNPVPQLHLPSQYT